MELITISCKKTISPITKLVVLCFTSFLDNRNGLMIWSDVERNTIYKKNLNGTGLVTALVTTNIAAVGEQRDSIDDST